MKSVSNCLSFSKLESVNYTMAVLQSRIECHIWKRHESLPLVGGILEIRNFVSVNKAIVLD